MVSTRLTFAAVLLFMFTESLYFLPFSLSSHRPGRHDRGDLQQGEERDLEPERSDHLGAVEGISMTAGEHYLDAATKYARPARLPVIRWRWRRRRRWQSTLTTFPPQPQPVAGGQHLT